uniref:Small ribosomal subunit protein mS23 n=1 Tax=Tabanus bromius TaxID=304241 RepID=A0A0K8TNZ7_TABBR
MASSRLEKIGTIYSRVTGLLRSGAMKPENKPIWYELYAAFPPSLEPRYDRPVPKIPIRELSYDEDLIRAKYEKLEDKVPEVIDMSDNNSKTYSAEFVDIYTELSKQGALDDEKVVEVANSMLQEKIKSRPKKEFPRRASNLVENFAGAKEGSSLKVEDVFKA